MLEHCIQRNHAIFHLQFSSIPFSRWLIEKLRGCVCLQIAKKKPIRPFRSFARYFVSIFMCISGLVWCHHFVLVFNFITDIVFLLCSKIEALQNQFTAASQSTEPLRKVSTHAQLAVHMQLRTF